MGKRTRPKGRKVTWMGDPIAHAHITREGRMRETSVCGLPIQIGRGAKQRCEVCDATYRIAS